ncbi:MAG TPA: carboxypeptidase regulatory-like domain-containing protein, partial [Bryobacteraceae bacterium]|nr:carboxypeptidase regulatory-like domain-containing protein [Bryobacteraceae bacterium]
ISGRGRLVRAPFVLWFFVHLLSLPPASAAGITLSGRVVDENNAPVADAQVTVRRAAPARVPAATVQTRTGPSGAFTVIVPEPGEYLISAAHEGYYELTGRPLTLEASVEITLVLNTVEEVFQSVNVNEQPSPIDISETQNQSRLTGTEVNDIPYANSHSLRNALKLMPDVVQDGSGGLHVNGAQENQVQYLLNGFDITNPISGQFQTLLAVEGIRSIDLSTGRYSPELGRGSAGALAINTTSGTDAFHYTATDFLPGLSLQEGLHLGNWYPRAGFSGPIRKGRAWFSDTVDFEYTESIIPGLPGGQNTRSGLAGSELLHVQANVTPANILFADFLLNNSHQYYLGLGVLTPISTTSNLNNREYFGSIKDQIFSVAGMMIELGYGHNDFLAGQTPQGSGLYVLSPEGASGNYFVRSTQTTARDQMFVHAAAPRLHWLGSHHIEAGSGVNLLNYHGNFDRTGYEVKGISGSVLSQTLYEGPGVFTVRDTEQSSWLRDVWSLSKRLQVDLGIRQDWERRVNNVLLAPRLAFSWAPFASGRTR